MGGEAQKAALGEERDSGDTTADQLSVAVVVERPGTIIGRYKLLELIGEGGFGSVFMAEQEHPVRRRVALKVIKLGMDTKDVVARFEAERQALALMDHPNIAHVLDAGSTATGRPFFVMELVRGSPITEFCDRRKMSTPQRVELLAQVCRAVQHAHSKGVIHRDLKPSNVLVTTADDKPVPKVIDFGIAKATQTRLTDRTLFTAFRQLVGTPQYMSPEQADSDGVDVDTRTDVYSLGVLTYEVLVGTTPFDAKSLRAAAMDEIRRIIRDVEPQKPSTRLSGLGESLGTVAVCRGTDSKSLRQSLRGELDWIVMKAMEKDRSRRYETAVAMADDLERYLAGKAVAAGPVGGTYRLKKLARRYKAAIAVAAFVALSLAIAVAGITVGWVRATRQERIAQEQRIEAQAQRAIADQQRAVAEQQRAAAMAGKTEAESQREKAQAVVDFITGDVLSKASPVNLKDNSVRETLVKALIEPAAATIGDRFKNQPVIQASIQQVLAEMLGQLGRYDLAIPQARAALSTRMSLLGELDADTLQSQRELGLMLTAAGDRTGGQQFLKNLWELRKSSAGEDDPKTILALKDYTESMWYGQLPLKEQLCEKAWNLSQKTINPDTPESLKLMSNYAESLKLMRQYAQAEKIASQAWKRAHEKLGDDDLETAAILLNYVDILKNQGKFPVAEPLARQVWQTYRTQLGKEHPDTVVARGIYLTVLQSTGRYDDAEKVLNQEGVLSPDPAQRMANVAERARLLSEQADQLDHQFRPDDAIADYKKAVDLLRDNAPDAPRRGQILYAYALCLMKVKQYSQAEAVLRENMAYDLKHPGIDAPALPWSYWKLRDCLRAEHKPAESAASAATTQPAPMDATALSAMDLRGRGDWLVSDHHPADAQPLFEQAIKLDRAGGQPGRNALANDLVLLANCLSRAGEGAKGLPALQEAVLLYRQDRPMEDPDRRDTVHMLANLLVKLNRANESVLCFQEVIASGDAAHISADGKVNDRIGLAKSQEAANDLPGAESTLRQAIKIGQDEWGPDTNQIAVPARQLIALLKQQNRTSDADAIAALPGLKPATEPTVP